MFSYNEAEGEPRVALYDLAVVIPAIVALADDALRLFLGISRCAPPVLTLKDHLPRSLPPAFGRCARRK